jgi:hypothetical protein
MGILPIWSENNENRFAGNLKKKASPNFVFV